MPAKKKREVKIESLGESELHRQALILQQPDNENQDERGEIVNKLIDFVLPANRYGSGAHLQIGYVKFIILVWEVRPALLPQKTQIELLQALNISKNAFYQHLKEIRRALGRK